MHQKNAQAKAAPKSRDEIPASNKRLGIEGKHEYVPVAVHAPFMVHFPMIDKPRKILAARFFENERGKMPVRDWLLSLNGEDRKIIGDDIQDAEFGWPIGMPLCRSMSGYKDLWEIRSSLSNGRIARVMFCVHEGHMALLHGFIKKSQKTPNREIEIAEKRMRGLKQ